VLQGEPLAEARRLFEVLEQLELGVNPTAETQLAVTRMLSKPAVEELAKKLDINSGTRSCHSNSSSCTGRREPPGKICHC